MRWSAILIWGRRNVTRRAGGVKGARHEEIAFRHRDHDDCRFAGLGGRVIISAAAVARVPKLAPLLLLTRPRSWGGPLPPTHTVRSNLGTHTAVRSEVEGQQFATKNQTKRSQAMKLHML